MGGERKTVRVPLRVEILCDVDVSAPDEDGQAEVHGIKVAEQGNMAAEVWTETSALSADEFAAIDEAARRAFEREEGEG